MAHASAALYAEFVRELEIQSGISSDLRDQGCIAFVPAGNRPGCDSARPLSTSEQHHLEPLLSPGENAYLLPECSVDPRALGQALLAADKRCGVDFVTGSPATEVLVANGHAAGVRTERSRYPAAAVVNCAGAWASQLQPFGVPTYPIKGQMVCLVPKAGLAHPGLVVQHVVRAEDVYIIPRSDGRILLGATVEEAGFDKHVDPGTIQRLHQLAANVVPALAEMRIHEAWAGLRPGTPDKLPILGETPLSGYFAATGHYRDGILLAPVTALVMSQLLMGKLPDFDLASFSPQRFS
jgi:glycine/D-amino acid oxidase-like deaminating enzyme